MKRDEMPYRRVIRAMRTAHEREQLVRRIGKALRLHAAYAKRNARAVSLDPSLVDRISDMLDPTGLEHLDDEWVGHCAYCGKRTTEGPDEILCAECLEATS